MKSANDLATQTDRILDIAGNRGFTDNKPNDQFSHNVEIMDKAKRTTDKYIMNIATYFGRNDGYISNEVYNIPVPRAIYAKRTL